ncbi:pyrroline-5-carboxylate reductase [Kangiella sp. TOML190]|uniref:pyrroline-5-carboxylate reductase n=1 Tax=Kangiella sp. TOML190 TaxID=2931351 RepID=UPI00203E2AAD|nr:pyrroline-5-carboxylate reductase [Kangiella sp. TOML190]
MMTSCMQTLEKVHIGFIGAGNMAQAIIHGLLSNGLSQNQVACSNPSNGKLEALKQQYPNLTTSNHNRQVVETSDIVIFAVKPQKLAAALTPLADQNFSNKLLISVAAGVETETFSTLLKQELAVVRAMPNTPALIGQGATGLFATESVNRQQKSQSETIFDAVGKSAWLEQEQQMDLVTAIAGSAPAYYFLFLEAIIDSAIAQGMDPKTAKLLASQTAFGASSMVAQDLSQDIATLRTKVTSPGGTTAAALASFEQSQFQSIVDKAIKSAVNRGIELAKIAKEQL